jgi:hypothetical protein
MRRAARTARDAQRRAEVVDAAVSLLAPPGDRLLEDGLDRAVARELPQERGAIVHRLGRQLRAVQAEERGHPEAVHVGPRVGVLRAVQRLGRAVHVGAERARPRPAGRVRGRDKVEIREPRLARGLEQDVRRLHVAVHEALGVRRAEGVADAQDEGNHLRGREALLDDRLVQVTAADELHDEEVKAAVLAVRLDDPHDAGVIEPRHALRPPEEALAPDRILREARMQHLDGDHLTLLVVASAPHVREAAAPDPIEEQVSPAWAQPVSGAELPPLAQLPPELQDLALRLGRVDAGELQRPEPPARPLELLREPAGLEVRVVRPVAVLARVLLVEGGADGERHVGPRLVAIGPALDGALAVGQRREVPERRALPVARPEQDRDHPRRAGGVARHRALHLDIPAGRRGDEIRADEQQDQLRCLEVLAHLRLPLRPGVDLPVVPRPEDPLALQQREVRHELPKSGFIPARVGNEYVDGLQHDRSRCQLSSRPLRCVDRGSK